MGEFRLIEMREKLVRFEEILLEKVHASEEWQETSSIGMDSYDPLVMQSLIAKHFLTLIFDERCVLSGEMFETIDLSFEMLMPEGEF